VLKALGLLNADPGTALYVGDSTHDMESGRAAGVWTAAVLWGPFNRQDLEPTDPDFWLERPADLVRLATDPSWPSARRAVSSPPTPE